MFKYYVSRYMNINKCAEIKEGNVCPECGADFEGFHETDFAGQLVKEYRRCPNCQPALIVNEHPLQ